MVERGQWLPLESPVVQAFKELFAVKLTDLDQYLEPEIER
jgi:hypothetical protein